MHYRIAYLITLLTQDEKLLHIGYSYELYLAGSHYDNYDQTCQLLVNTTCILRMHTYDDDKRSASYYSDQDNTPNRILPTQCMDQPSCRRTLQAAHASDYTLTGTILLLALLL